MPFIPALALVLGAASGCIAEEPADRPSSAQAVTTGGASSGSCVAEALGGLKTPVLRGSDRSTFYYVPTRWQVTHLRVERPTDESLAPPWDIAVPGGLVNGTVPADVWAIPANAQTAKGSASSPYFHHTVLAVDAVPVGAEDEDTLRAALAAKYPDAGDITLARMPLALAEEPGFVVQYIDETLLGAPSAATPSTLVTRLDAQGVGFLAWGDAILAQSATDKSALASMAATYVYPCGGETRPVQVRSVDTSTDSPFVYPAEYDEGQSALAIEAATSLQQSLADAFSLAYFVAQESQARIDAGAPRVNDQAFVDRLESIYVDLRTVIGDVDAALANAYPYSQYGAGFVARTTTITDVQAAGALAQQRVRVFVAAAFPKLGLVSPAPAAFDACMASVAADPRKATCLFDGQTDATARKLATATTFVSALLGIGGAYATAVKLASYEDAPATKPF